jgi:hypothetical protein
VEKPIKILPDRLRWLPAAKHLLVELAETISRITLSVLVMGNDKFKNQIERLTGQSVRLTKIGRPAKSIVLLTYKSTP